MKMQAIVLTNKGVESVSAQELIELGMSGVNIGEYLVDFSCDSVEDMCRVAYLSQSAERVIQVLADVRAQDVLAAADDLGDALREVKGVACVECVRFGEHEFSSVDVKKRVAKAIGRVDYDSFDTLVFVVVVHDRLVVGVDVAGRDLSKREFKVFANAFSLKAPVAYGLVRLSRWSGEGVLLDPLCRDGMVAIEAAHFATGLSVRRFEKRKLSCSSTVDLDALDTGRDMKGSVLAVDESFPNISAAKKNAKIAGMHKVIEFRKYALDDIDLHLQARSVSAVATSCGRVPAVFFERLAPVMASHGRIALLVQQAEGVIALAARSGFVLKSQSQVFMGKLACDVFLFEKKARKRVTIGK